MARPCWPVRPGRANAGWRSQDRTRSLLYCSSHGRPAFRRQAEANSHEVTMRFLHTMLRVRNLDAALHFYCELLGLEEVRRRTDEKNKFTLVFLAAPQDAPAAKAALAAGRRDAPMVELTYNWDAEDYGEARYFGHLAYEVDDIYAT